MNAVVFLRESIKKKKKSTNKKNVYYQFFILFENKNTKIGRYGNAYVHRVIVVFRYFHLCT